MKINMIWLLFFCVTVSSSTISHNEEKELTTRAPNENELDVFIERLKKTEPDLNFLDKIVDLIINDIEKLSDQFTDKRQAAKEIINRLKDITVKLIDVNQDLGNKSKDLVIDWINDTRNSIKNLYKTIVNNLHELKQKPKIV